MEKKMETTTCGIVYMYICVYIRAKQQVSDRTSEAFVQPEVHLHNCCCSRILLAVFFAIPGILRCPVATTNLKPKILKLQDPPGSEGSSPAIHYVLLAAKTGASNLYSQRYTASTMHRGRKSAGLFLNYGVLRFGRFLFPGYPPRFPLNWGCLKIGGTVGGGG